MVRARGSGAGMRGEHGREWKVSSEEPHQITQAFECTAQLRKCDAGSRVGHAITGASSYLGLPAVYLATDIRSVGSLSFHVLICKTKYHCIRVLQRKRTGGLCIHTLRERKRFVIKNQLTWLWRPSCLSSASWRPRKAMVESKFKGLTTREANGITPTLSPRSKEDCFSSTARQRKHILSYSGPHGIGWCHPR